MTIEEFQQALENIEMQFKRADYDARHLLLDLSEKILELGKQTPQMLPDNLKSEWNSICTDIDQVQPTFKSHRKTSSLFDRQGMGQPGRETAITLITRFVAITQLVKKLVNQKNPPV